MSNPLRVVHLGKYYPPSPGGIEGHTQTLARAQAALGADVRVLVVNHETRAGRDSTFDRFTTTPDKEELDGAVSITRVGRWACLAKLDVAPNLLRAVRRLARTKPDVWHMHAPNVTMMIVVLACPAVRPLVITHHSDIIRQRLLKYLVRPIEREAYSRAARLLPTSAEYASGSEILGRFASKVSPLPLGIDAGPFRESSPAVLGFERHLRERYGSPLWLMVGRLIYYKGLMVALDALHSVPGRLLVIGTGPMEADLKSRAVERGVMDRVIFHGRAGNDELAGAYRAATALWFPSTARSEGFGLVQVEAMASGCPVINTAIECSGVPWVSRHEREGLTVTVGDSDALAKASNRLLAEPGLRDRLGDAGRRRALTHFDHRVMAARSLDIYRAAIGSTP